MLSIGLVMVGLSNLLACAQAASAVAFVYHQFDRPQLVTTFMPPEAFDRQLGMLADNGFTVMSLADIVAHLEQGLPLPDHTVALSFDDASRSLYTIVYPRLRERGWPFTVFVSTDAVDRGGLATLSWAMIREMDRHGGDIENHSATHDHLVLRRPGESWADWRRRVRDDIVRAADRIEAETGHRPVLFAYPYGEYDHRLAELVIALGYAGVGQQSGAIGPGSDRRALPRYPMSAQYADDRDFMLKAESLAMPVVEVQPWDPLTSVPLGAEQTMRLVVHAGDLDDGRFRCYLSGPVDEPIHLEPPATSAQGLVYIVRHALPQGRSRFNCTAPSLSAPVRYYWYSHPWLNLEAPYMDEPGRLKFYSRGASRR